MILVAAVPTNLAEANRILIEFLIASFLIQGLLAVLTGYLAVRSLSRSQRMVMERFEKLREDSLKNYIALQKDENVRLVADTRAATAKMNVMADALWQGLQFPQDTTLPDTGLPNRSEEPG